MITTRNGYWRRNFHPSFASGVGPRAQRAPSGNYECWYFSVALQNFSRKGASFTDASGQSGSISEAGGKMLFARQSRRQSRRL
jgi:hypothetical protein